MMSHIKFVCISLLMLVLLNVSCVEEYAYSTAGNDQIMVVEGFISDRAGEQNIRLSLSGELNHPVQYVNSAKVEIIDQLGNTIPYENDTSGYYHPVDPGFIAQTGNGYKLSIEFDGKVYESDVVELPRSLELDSVAWTHSVFDSIQPDESGVFLSIKVHTNEDDRATQFYRYNLEQTFEIETLIKQDSIYNFDKETWSEQHTVFNGYFICPGIPEAESYYHIAPPEVIEAGRVTQAFVDEDRYYIFPNCKGYLRGSSVFSDNIMFWNWRASHVPLTVNLLLKLMDSPNWGFLLKYASR